MKTCIIAIFITAVSMIVSVTAQESIKSQVTVGSRVRLVLYAPETTKTNGEGEFVGEIIKIEADTLLIRAENRDAPVRVHVSSVKKLSVSRGEQSQVTKNALMGLFLGGIVGMGWGSQSAADWDLPDGQAILLGAGIIGAGGALIGAVIGANRTDEVWHEVQWE